MDQDIVVLLITEDVDGRYKFTCGPGMNVNEVAFGVAAFAKVMVRDGYIKKTSDFINQITKYINDPQYAEIKETDNGQDTSESTQS